VATAVHVIPSMTRQRGAGEGGERGVEKGEKKGESERRKGQGMTSCFYY
jgi:hypothetical protein